MNSKRIINEYNLINEYTGINYDYSKQIYGHITKKNGKFPIFLKCQSKNDRKHGSSSECDRRPKNIPKLSLL